jgi:hypothetical protein
MFLFVFLCFVFILHPLHCILHRLHCILHRLLFILYRLLLGLLFGLLLVLSVGCCFIHSVDWFSLSLVKGVVDGSLSLLLLARLGECSGIRKVGLCYNLFHTVTSQLGLAKMPVYRPRPKEQKL